MQRELTCIVCPRGCALCVELDGNNKILKIEGQSCKRGEVYAQNECTNPVRTLTTTVALEGGGVLPVKTDKPIPKALLFACMEEINRVTVKLPVSLGDVIIENILGTDANVVAVKNEQGRES